ncbi:MAG: zf-TFIIB domain-containing protein [Planctomycetes bacterium]|nr:zf-TFIIB domain-containing protein [Planctomycetota bacterium]
MKCPACDNQLEQRIVGDVAVDVCNNGCAGIWFDNFELEKFDEKHEAAGESLLQIERNPEISVDHSQKRHCPKCETQKMLKHFMSVKREVEVDECPNCGGFWLDAGELGQIRDQFETQTDREQAAHAYFSDTFGGDLEKMLAQGGEKQKRARSIARIFRFVSPSYYIPGKQKWGAF